MKYILALDQGTTSSRAIVFDRRGNILGMAQSEFRQIYPKSGWVEHNPLDIKSSQFGAVTEALVRSGVGIDDIQAIGITNQRETTIVWDKRTGQPVYNAIVWQCRRTAEDCEQLKNSGLERRIYEKTGLIVDPYFSATKIKWILDNVEGARARAERGELLFGTVDTYLMWQLSEGKIFATDYTNASRTMLFNIHTLQWDKELLELFGIPECMLPKAYPSSHKFGVTSNRIFGREIPICGVAGDQQAALFGQLCTNRGDVKNTYGTGCFMLMNTGNTPVESKNGLVTTIAASVGGKVQYALEGSVFIAGAVVQWLRDGMRLVENAAETERIATSVADAGGVYIVPAFVGLGAPYWDSDARGTVVGITRGTRREHFVRAALESIAYQVQDILQAMQSDLNIKISSLNVDGGASANNFLMQFQSDLLNCEIDRPAVVETTALGTAYLAGLASGYWKDEKDICDNRRIGKIFTPAMEENKRKELLDGWRKAVRQTRTR